MNDSIILTNKNNMKDIITFVQRALCTVAVCVLAHVSAMAQNPYLPLWEYIPDGEPYVFDDPDVPGKKRVYVYGSHDSRIKDYCGLELVTWSASLDSLDKWRYDGVIFESKKDAKGNYLHADKRGDVLFAPDVMEVKGNDGKKTYYLYPNNQEGGRNGMVARSNRPDGPFEVVNWSKGKSADTDGVLRFDPAVFIDDDGRVYGYWGFKEPFVAELDPSTMATVKPGTEVKQNYINGYESPGEFRFFEASSIRKIKDKYVLIYSRFTADGEFGLPMSNYTLAYAYASSPMGPYTYGGTIIDGRGREVNEHGVTVFTATPDGNTHGSICEINGQWWVFYHRQCGLDEYSRQAMVAPVEVDVTEGADGKVVISEGEYTSEGFMIKGLNPFKRYSAGIACYYTGVKPGKHEWPKHFHYGSYVKPLRLNGVPEGDVYDLSVNTNPVVNNTDGSVVGYKYFNLDNTYDVQNVHLCMTVVPEGQDGAIDIYIDRPSAEGGGVKVGSVALRSSMPKTKTSLMADVSKVSRFKGKHALFFVIHATEKDKSLCEIHDFVFTNSN